MAMGTRKVEQASLFLTVGDLPVAPKLPVFEKLNEVLNKAGFDEYVEGICRPFYAEAMGRRSLPPGVYFRILLLGYLLGIDSKRGIALQAHDSLSIRKFLCYGLQESTPDHSTISKTRRRISPEAHQEVFTWMLSQLRASGLAKGEKVAVDAAKLGANAAIKTLQRKESKASYKEFVEA